VSLSELGDLLKSRRQPRQFTTPTQSLDGLQLVVRSSARPNEVRVVGIRQAIGARPGRRHDRPLFEQQHCPARAGKGKCVGDRLDSLCVRDSVPPAVEDSKADSFLGCDAREKVGSLGPCAADLEVRGTLAAE